MYFCNMECIFALIFVGSHLDSTRFMQYINCINTGKPLTWLEEQEETVEKMYEWVRNIHFSHNILMLDFEVLNEKPIETTCDAISI